MQLREVMTPSPEIVHPDAPVKEAATKMRALNVGALPVCDGDRLVGLITDRDITIRATADGRDPAQTTIRDTMTDDIVYCFEDQNIEEAARIMAEKQVRRLPILNRDKRLVGIVSLGALVVNTNDDTMAGQTLRKISQPAKPTRE